MKNMNSKYIESKLKSQAQTTVPKPQQCHTPDCKATGMHPIYSEHKKDYIWFCEGCFARLMEGLLLRG